MAGSRGGRTAEGHCAELQVTVGQGSAQLKHSAKLFHPVLNQEHDWLKSVLLRPQVTKKEITTETRKLE